MITIMASYHMNRIGVNTQIYQILLYVREVLTQFIL